MPTMREVAEKAEVSITTVSHVINKTRPVSDELSARVLESMDLLGYQPNLLARSLRLGETKTIGVILPDSANPFFAEVARGIEDTGFEEGYSVIICNSDNNQDKEKLYIDVLYEKQVDGIIFVSTGESTKLLSDSREQKKPFVIVDRMMPGINSDSVMTDNEKGGYLATSHLIQLGHRKISCIRGPSGISPSANRFTGYCRALEEHKIPLDETFILDGDFHFQSGYTNTLDLLKLDNPPTAIFALNDLMAVGAIAAAQKIGKNVPTDISIIGFDDIDLAAYVHPPLTTISQPKYEIGVMATNLLLDRIQDNNRQPRSRTLDIKLLIRESTASPR